MKNKKIRILIVDDHLMWRKTLQLSFSALPNVEIINTLPDGYRAVDFCKQIHPDLILLDVNLPGMDGFKTACELLKDNPDLWIIGVAADVTPAMEKRAKESGMKVFVRKDLLLDYLPFSQPFHFSRIH